jgi:transposase
MHDCSDLTHCHDREVLITAHALFAICHGLSMWHKTLNPWCLSGLWPKLWVMTTHRALHGISQKPMWEITLRSNGHPIHTQTCGFRNQIAMIVTLPCLVTGNSPKDAHRWLDAGSCGQRNHAIAMHHKTIGAVPQINLQPIETLMRSNYAHPSV